MDEKVNGVQAEVTPAPEVIAAEEVAETVEVVEETGAPSEEVVEEVAVDAA